MREASSARLPVVVEVTEQEAVVEVLENVYWTGLDHR
jgi:hypothetical protein